MNERSYSRSIHQLNRTQNKFFRSACLHSEDSRIEEVKAHLPLKIYFCLGASKRTETFIVIRCILRWVLCKINFSQKNIQPFKSDLQIMGQNLGVRAYKNVMKLFSDFFKLLSADHRIKHLRFLHVSHSPSTWMSRLTDDVRPHVKINLHLTVFFAKCTSFFSLNAFFTRFLELLRTNYR